MTATINILRQCLRTNGHQGNDNMNILEAEKEMWDNHKTPPKMHLFNTYQPIRTLLDDEKHWDELHEDCPDPLYSN